MGEAAGEPRCRGGGERCVLEREVRQVRQQRRSRKRPSATPIVGGVDDQQQRDDEVAEVTRDATRGPPPGDEQQRHDQQPAFVGEMPRASRRVPCSVGWGCPPGARAGSIALGARRAA